MRRRALRPPVDGVLVLDKPLGLSSNTAMMAVRRLLDAPKAGHGGTLDPLATGVLPLLFGEATKFAADLLEADKTYEAVLRLGVVTTTGDGEGEIVQERPVAVDAVAVAAACGRFTGWIEQVPPMHSALKRDGRPLYAYAREGVVVDRAPRRVRIDAIDVLAFEPPLLTVEVRCSKGTYVRTLAEDIGTALGCGAHLAGLRRTVAGPASIARSVTLDALTAMAPADRAGVLLPIDALLRTMPRVDLERGDAERLRQGQRVVLARGAARFSPTMPAMRTRVRVYRDERLLGVADFDPPGLLSPQRLVAQRDPIPDALGAAPAAPAGSATSAVQVAAQVAAPIA